MKKKVLGSTPTRRLSIINAKVSSTISISLVLFLLGLIVLLLITARSISVYVKENISFNILLSENMSDADAKKLQKQLDVAPYVKSTEMISKEQALNDLINELGEDPRVLLGSNPLRPSIEVFLRSDYANKDSIAVIEKQLKDTESSINSISYREDMVEAMNNNIRKLSLAITALAIILLVISFALINNTIQMSVYSKRFLIRTMKLVGATGGFIRMPFIRDHIFAGVIASIIAIIGLSALIYNLSISLNDFMGVINVQSVLIISILVLIFGISITGLSAYFAVNRYLHMDLDKLYN